MARRRLSACPGVNPANSPRYTRLVFDLFAQPIGAEPPDQNNEDEDIVLPSPIPPEAFEHRGKWLALHNREILAVRDTEEELEKEFGDRGHEVSFFHVSPTPIYAR